MRLSDPLIAMASCSTGYIRISKSTTSGAENDTNRSKSRVACGRIGDGAVAADPEVLEVVHLRVGVRHTLGLVGTDARRALKHAETNETGGIKSRIEEKVRTQMWSARPGAMNCGYEPGRYEPSTDAKVHMSRIMLRKCMSKYLGTRLCERCAHSWSRWLSASERRYSNCTQNQHSCDEHGRMLVYRRLRHAIAVCEARSPAHWCLCTLGRAEVDEVVLVDVLATEEPQVDDAARVRLGSNVTV